MNTMRASKLATMAHQGQEDLAGDPYIGHVARVARSVDSGDATVVAFLHDTVEDSDMTISEIRDQFPDHIAEAVDLVTHDGDDSYDEYIDQIAGNDLATQVKLADLEDNLNLSRLSEITDDDLDRAVTYGHAHRKLTEASQ